MGLAAIWWGASGMSGARDAEVRQVLSDLEGAFDGGSAALLTRAGSVFAGNVPQGVGRESFGAMMAVLHGASETGTQEMGDPLESVEAHMSAGSLIVAPAGAKMILVLHVRDGSDGPSARQRVREAAKRLEPLF